MSRLTLLGAGKAPYRAHAVRFDGVNDWLNRGAGLTGAADNKFLLSSCWIRKQGADGAAEYIWVSDISGVVRIRLQKLAGNGVSFLGRNAAGTNILNVSSSTNVAQVADGWVHVLASFDMADTGKRWLYVNDASDLPTITTYTNDTLDWTTTEFNIGADATGATAFDGDIADFMLWPTYLDLSVAGNRRLFISAAGQPVDPAVAIATLGAPIILQCGPLASWHTNKGSGGGFTVNGALAASATSPSD